MKVKEAADQLSPGEELEVRASDGGFAKDLPAFCEANRYEFLGVRQEKGIVIGKLRIPNHGDLPSPTNSAPASNNNATLVVFSQEMDKVMAGLVIANGALAMGGKATLF